MKIKDAPTLADRVYQATFSDKFRNPLILRQKLLKARRFIWALLASINDLPVTNRKVMPAGGFNIHRGPFKRYLDHRTITLKVPQDRDLRTLARKVVAGARKRAHMVRGHWRDNWRYPSGQLCEHEWDAAGACSNCHGRRSWVSEHQRGDPAIGVLFTDYAVTH
jgi:hypothetical protein